MTRELKHPCKEFYISDHVGNRRVLFSDLNDDGRIQPSEILGNYNNYPFGLRWDDGTTDYTDRFRYVSKGYEQQTGLGLNYRRSQYRFLDPSIGRFLSVDPLVDQFPGRSPYNYTANNPISNIDYMGLAPVSTTGGGGGGNPLAWVAEGWRQYFQGAARAVDNVRASVSKTVKTIIGKAEGNAGGSSSSYNSTSSATAHTNLEQFFERHGDSNSPVIDQPIVEVETSQSTTVSTNGSLKIGVANATVSRSESTDGSKETTKVGIGTNLGPVKVGAFVSETQSQNSTKTKVGVEASTTVKSNDFNTTKSATTFKFSIFFQNEENN